MARLRQASPERDGGDEGRDGRQDRRARARLRQALREDRQDAAGPAPAAHARASRRQAHRASAAARRARRHRGEDRAGPGCAQEVPRLRRHIVPHGRPGQVERDLRVHPGLLPSARDPLRDRRVPVRWARHHRASAGALGRQDPVRLELRRPPGRLQVPRGHAALPARASARPHRRARRAPEAARVRASWRSP